MLTILITTRNNAATIKQTLDSLQPLSAQIQVCDLGSTDETLNICSKYKVKINNFTFEHNISNIKNRIIEQTCKKWIFLVEPWEIVIKGHDEINRLIKGGSDVYKAQVIQNEILGKEIRLWHKSQNLKFCNPVFEYISGSGKITNILLYNLGGYSLTTYEEQNKIIEQWKKSDPLSPDPYYYAAFSNLSKGDHEQFMVNSERYLFKSKGMSATMMRYYQAYILLKVFDDVAKSISNVGHCILDNPKMAEFWCLLGDIHFRINKFINAIEFYDFGMILGSQRSNDDWSMDIKKYKEYPKKMIEKCKELI